MAGNTSMNKTKPTEIPAKAKHLEEK